MSVFTGEADLVEVLAKAIEAEWKYVRINVNLASFNFRKYWQKWFKDQSCPVTQPQIDLILVDTTHHLHAIEVKYFRMALSQVTLSYYEGVGETLALLRMGFCSATLMHFFDEEIPLETVNSYVCAASDLISRLNLPIGYKMFRVTDISGKKVFFDPTPRSLEEKPYVSSQPVLPAPLPKENPFHDHDSAVRIEDFIRHALRIPKPSSNTN
jgi:hypothetical protein